MDTDRLLFAALGIDPDRQSGPLGISLEIRFRDGQAQENDCS
ncbi:hypothetical protein [Desulfosarcina cetonica]|nr:hypothetical protein [Desulfosarcina cetonica]